MPHYERESVSITTGSSSAAGSGTTSPANGHLVAIIYVEDGTAPLETATIVITGNTTGIVLWSKTGVDANVNVYPLAAAVLASTGAAITNSGVPVPLANEAIAIAVSVAGNSKTGVFTFIIEGSFMS